MTEEPVAGEFTAVYEADFGEGITEEELIEGFDETLYCWSRVNGELACVGSWKIERYTATEYLAAHPEYEHQGRELIYVGTIMTLLEEDEQ